MFLSGFVSLCQQWIGILVVIEISNGPAMLLMSYNCEDIFLKLCESNVRGFQ